MFKKIFAKLRDSITPSRSSKTAPSAPAAKPAGHSKPHSSSSHRADPRADRSSSHGSKPSAGGHRDAKSHGGTSGHREPRSGESRGRDDHGHGTQGTHGRGGRGSFQGGGG